MKTSLEQILNAVLYEGYIFHPDHASSQKHQRERFTFGRVYPQIYSENQNDAEPCAIQTECLLKTQNAPPKLHITLGFLQPMKREIRVLEKVLPVLTADTDPDFQTLSKLAVNGGNIQAWTEAVERQVSISPEILPPASEIPFSFPANRQLEPILNESGRVAGVILRHQEFLAGKIEIKTEFLEAHLLKISVRVVNSSPVNKVDLQNSEKVLRRTFASTHVVLGAANAEFISLLQPPANCRRFAADCRNLGVWPVLVGDETRGERGTMLASPIILYDYPRIVPKRAGSGIDGTEMDEMLTARVLTLTHVKKRAMPADGFSRRILERTPALDAESFQRLPGVTRNVKPGRSGMLSRKEFFNPVHPVKSVLIAGREVKAGDRVSICPKRRTVAMDLLLAGKTATIQAIEQDAEAKIHLALVLEDDPGRDPGLARLAGHRFFYGPDEIQPLKGAAGT